MSCLSRGPPCNRAHFVARCFPLFCWILLKTGLRLVCLKHDCNSSALPQSFTLHTVNARCSIISLAGGFMSWHIPLRRDMSTIGTHPRSDHHSIWRWSSGWYCGQRSHTVRPLCCALHTETNQASSEQHEIRYRKLSSIDLSDFREDLKDSTVLQESITDLPTLVDKYETEIKRVLDIHTPERKRMITMRPVAAWYNDDIVR